MQQLVAASEHEPGDGQQKRPDATFEIQKPEFRRKVGKKTLDLSLNDGAGVCWAAVSQVQFRAHLVYRNVDVS